MVLPPSVLSLAATWKDAPPSRLDGAAVRICDCAVIGGGPAGLSAAVNLVGWRRAGQAVFVRSLALRASRKTDGPGVIEPSGS